MALRAPEQRLPAVRLVEWESGATMRGDARILVIGSAALGGDIARALPRCRGVTVDTPLTGLWTVGHEAFDGVVVSLSGGRGDPRVISGLRDVAPRARIVVTCAAAQEPQARAAIKSGADDYILEPVSPDDLRAAFELAPAAPGAVQVGNLPSFQEIVQLGDVLKSLGAGPQAALDRLAGMLRQAFETDGVTIQMDELSAGAGATGTAVLQELVRRHDQVVGSVALGPRTGGTYTPADAARLADYARLIETIVAQARDQAHWQDLAWRDDLSGLRNRRYFDATLDELLTRANEQRLRVTVILFDIDGFKSYNDTYGHDTGDALIREVALLLTRCSRERDVVARYGGDEFAIIIWDSEGPRVPGSQHPRDALEVAERFQTVIRGHEFKCVGPGAPGPVTLSGGLACFPWDGKTRVEIVRAADAALLAAKQNGKDYIELAATGTP